MFLAPAEPTKEIPAVAPSPPPPPPPRLPSRGGGNASSAQTPPPRLLSPPPATPRCLLLQAAAGPAVSSARKRSSARLWNGPHSSSVGRQERSQLKTMDAWPAQAIFRVLGSTYEPQPSPEL